MSWNRASAVIFAMILSITPGLLWAQDVPQVIKAMGPWEANGVAYQIGAEKTLFVGKFSGIMVLEEKGEAFDAAEFTCPSTQEVDYAAGRSKSSGYCIFDTSGANKVFAKWHCKGAIGECEGAMEFTAGTGGLEGIKGGGVMKIRSFFMDISDTEEGEAMIDKAIGVVSWPELQVELEGD